MRRHRKDPDLRLIVAYVRPGAGLRLRTAEHTQPLDFGLQAVLKVQ